MATYGCTSPFELDQDHICKNVTFVHNITQDWYEGSYITQLYTRNTTCLHPCMFIEAKVDPLVSLPYYTSLKFITFIYLPKLVNVMTTQYTYTELSLVAEIGGYVGLFLGVSVLQVSGLMKVSLGKLWLLADRWNHQRRE